MPYDPYGWLSGQKLLAWAKAARGDENTPQPLGDQPFWLDSEDWLERVAADSSVDPVVIYVGLHGGVDQHGDPILYTGRDEPGSPFREADRSAVKLETVLAKLDEKARRKRKVLVLDTGRGLPESNLGEVYPDFARAVKEKLGERIAKTPTLAVILAAGDGERAWDSPDLGYTALAYHLMKAFAGAAAPEGLSAYTGEDLYQYVRRETEAWSRNNRPSVQRPVLLPELEE
ncbi:hypothetical protein [Fimbriiglobus ruber]|uniref:Uncharacterized protein n=1 Tax=Fimbriiglobus ruber TaxID=1908690 RepID=A0A225DML1_9BACT|nr:hypothetical protein [Fimbriiglobus ruber]OWK40854.1 hypothetical protein FRUB_04746 [Fimbriiglobus ruber]